MQIGNTHSMEQIRSLSMESIANITKEEFIANYHRIRHMIFSQREFIVSLQAAHGSIFEKKENNDNTGSIHDATRKKQSVPNSKNSKKSNNKTNEEFGVIAELREMALWNRMSHKYTDEEESLMWELIRLFGSLSQCPENASSMCKNWAVKDELELFKRFYDSCFHLAFDNPEKLNNMITVYSRILAKRRQVRLCDFFG